MSKRWTFTWRDAEHKVKLQKLVEHPTIERLRVRQAIDGLRLQSWENIMFWNPYKNVNGAFQWLDFVVNYNGKPFVILFKAGHRLGGAKPREKVEIQVKQKFLKERGIPYVIFKRNLSTMDYQFKLRNRFLTLGAEGAEAESLLHPA